MKRFLIKCGKAWSIVKRDGVLGGTARIWQALRDTYQPIGEGAVLFISGGVGDSARYRCTHVAQWLAQNDITAAVTTQDHPQLDKALKRFCVFVLHRTLMTEAFTKTVATIQEQNNVIIFETDDLVHDPAHITETDYYKNANTLEKKLYEHGVGGELLADARITHATTTTSFLAKNLERYGKDVFLVPNVLSEKDLAAAKRAVAHTPEHHDARVRIGYFSGTASHNKDFATVESVLLELLAAHDDLELYLVGPLEISERFAPYSERVITERFISGKDAYFHALRSADIHIAPLEVDNPFCQAKSPLKFLEAAAVERPIVAAGTDAFGDVVQEGVNGYTASSTEEWREKLSALIAKPSERLKMGQEAHKTVMKQYTTSSPLNAQYVAFLKDAIREAASP